MAKAIRRPTTIPIADLTADPILRAFFRRGPDSAGFLIPAYRPVRPLDGLARAEPEEDDDISDRESSMGWKNEGGQGSLGFDQQDLEADRFVMTRKDVALRNRLRSKRPRPARPTITGVVR